MRGVLLTSLSRWGAGARKDQGDPAKMWDLELSPARSPASALGWMTSLRASGIAHHLSHRVAGTISMLPISNVCRCFVINRITFHQSIFWIHGAIFEIRYLVSKAMHKNCPNISWVHSIDSTNIDSWYPWSIDQHSAALWILRPWYLTWEEFGTCPPDLIVQVASCL